MQLAALVLCGSFVIEGTIVCISNLVQSNLLYLFHSFHFLMTNEYFLLGASLVVAVQAVKQGAAAEGMKLRDYVWRGHDPTSVAVMTEVSLDSQQCCTLCSSKK